jgi:hypothetical protein
MAKDIVISTPSNLFQKWRDVGRKLRVAGASQGSNGGQLRPEQRRMVGVLVRVKCIKTSGSNGGPGVRATWVYTVKTLLDQELLTNATPEELPILGVPYTEPAIEGAKGDAYINQDGDWVLARVWLDPQTEVCEAASGLGGGGGGGTEDPIDEGVFGGVFAP